MNGLVQDVGVYALSWDGFAEGGAPAPDDEYLAALVGEAPEGGAAESTDAGVIVDRLPPAVVVQQPTAGSQAESGTTINLVVWRYRQGEDPGGTTTSTTQPGGGGGGNG